MNDARETAEGALTVQLELHLDHNPVTGRMRTQEGVELPFVGWIGFVDALHRLAGDNRWELR